MSLPHEPPRLASTLITASTTHIRDFSRLDLSAHKHTKHPPYHAQLCHEFGRFRLWVRGFVRAPPAGGTILDEVLEVAVYLKKPTIELLASFASCLLDDSLDKVGNDYTRSLLQLALAEVVTLYPQLSSALEYKWEAVDAVIGELRECIDALFDVLPTLDNVMALMKKERQWNGPAIAKPVPEPCMTGTEATQTGHHATPPVEEGHEIPGPPPRCELPLLLGDDAPVERGFMDILGSQGMGASPNTPGSRHSISGWEREEEDPPERAFHEKSLGWVLHEEPPGRPGSEILGALEGVFQEEPPAIAAPASKGSVEKAFQKEVATGQSGSARRVFVKYPCPYNEHCKRSLLNSDPGGEHILEKGCVNGFNKLNLLIRHIGRVHLKPHICDRCGLRCGLMYETQRHKDRRCRGRGDKPVPQVPEIVIELYAMLRRCRNFEQLERLLIHDGKVVYDYARASIEPKPRCEESDDEDVFGGESDDEDDFGAGTAGRAGAMSQNDNDGLNTSPAPPNELSFAEQFELLSHERL